MKSQSKPSILETNILYLLLGISLLLIGSLVQSREIYSGLLITEYILILLPNLLFLKFKGYSIKKVLRLNRIKFRQIIKVILITIFTYPLAVFLQAIFIGILSIFKEVTPTGVPLPQDGIQFIISFFIIAISPGICEEVMFRGVVLDAYERLGHKKSIIISAFLFSIFHFNILNMVGPFILGIVFGIMVYKTNSIYTSIVGHTVNNGIALTIGYFVNKYYYLIDDLMEAEVDPNTMSSGIKEFIWVVLFLSISLFIVVRLLKSLSPNEDEDYYSNESNIIELKDYIEYKEEIIDYKNETIIEKLKYIPIFLIIIIFIFFNAVYFFI